MNGEEACYLCGHAAVDPTKEHLIPLSRGGKKRGDNLKVACAECNMLKSDMTLDEFKHFIRTEKLHPDYVEHITKQKK